MIFNGVHITTITKPFIMRYIKNIPTSTRVFNEPHLSCRKRNFEDIFNRTNDISKSDQDE
jgi:hypothetical protein